MRSRNELSWALDLPLGGYNNIIIRLVKNPAQAQLFGRSRGPLRRIVFARSWRWRPPTLKLRTSNWRSFISDTNSSPNPFGFNRSLSKQSWNKVRSNSKKPKINASVIYPQLKSQIRSTKHEEIPQVKLREIVIEITPNKVAQKQQVSVHYERKRLAMQSRDKE